MALSATAIAGVTNPIKCYNSLSQYTSFQGRGYYYVDLKTDHGSLGLKGNLTTGGQPQIFDSNNQHIDVYVGSYEGRVAPNAGEATELQVGWRIGTFQTCTGSIPTEKVVYVEVYDDTNTSPTSSCFTATYRAASPSGSYDTRYYMDTSVGGQTYHEYRIYFEEPGSGRGIEYLAYGDYLDYRTAAHATAAVLGGKSDAQILRCPILRDTSASPARWNVLGNYPGDGTFANYLQLWKGSYWDNWTLSTAPSTTISADAPYQYQVTSPYVTIKAGGGQ
jgi:hypothetical protein